MPCIEPHRWSPQWLPWEREQMAWCKVMLHYTGSLGFTYRKCIWTAEIQLVDLNPICSEVEGQPWKPKRWFLHSSIDSFFCCLHEELVLCTTVEPWLCKITEEALTALFGWGNAQLSDIWLWFVYVCCQWSPPPDKNQSPKTCMFLWVKVKWACDVGLRECTSCGCNRLFLTGYFQDYIQTLKAILCIPSPYVKGMNWLLINWSVS